MIINGIHVTAIMVDGHPYLTARNLDYHPSKIHAVIDTSKPEALEFPSDWDIVKKLEVVTHCYETSPEHAAEKFDINVTSVKHLIKLFESDKLE